MFTEKGSLKIYFSENYAVAGDIIVNILVNS